MPDWENSDSPQVKLMLEWAQGFEKKDMAIIAKCLHKDYRHTYYPRSLGKPEVTKEQWLEHVTGVVNLWTDHKLTIHSITDAPGRIAVHLTNRADTSIGVQLIRESIFIGHIVTDEDGSLKIKHTEEFTDSKTYLDTTQAIAAAKAKG